MLAKAKAAPIDYDDEREVRLRLGRLIEPEDQLFVDLLELVEPASLLHAVVEGKALEPPIPDGLAAKLDGRRAGLGFRLALADPAADLEAGERIGARYLIPGDAGWPSALDDLGGRAPLGLWITGGFPPDAPTIAMVGARACTGYGLQAAGNLAAELAKDGVTIVSGAALGVDGAAHRGALAVGGITVAVLACGVDRRYPAAHHNLIQAIGERGAVIAELPPGTAPTRFRFLSRNRLIAGLTAATVVVEAAGRSGSLVTARLAAELGRAVFAVPGPITSRLSMGTNGLLCDGAIPALTGRQIEHELGVEPRKPLPPVSPSTPQVNPSPGPVPTHVPALRGAPPLPPASPPAQPPPPAAPTASDPAATALATPPSAPSFVAAEMALPELAAAPATQPSPVVPGTAGTGAPPAAADRPPASVQRSAAHVGAHAPLDRDAVLVREALPTVRSGRATDVTALAAETGLAPSVVLAALGLLAACGIAVKTGGGWALLRSERS